MNRIEPIELSQQRNNIVKDVNALIEKYRTVFKWDVPNKDEDLTNTLILNAILNALDDLKNKIL